MYQPHWLMSPDGKLIGVQCGEERILRNGTFEEFCEAAVYFLLTKLPRETCEMPRITKEEFDKLLERCDIPPEWYEDDED